MATAWIRLEAFDSLPGVCAKTGERTDLRRPVVAEYVPGALRWLQVFGAWSFFFGRSGRRRRHVRLPISRRALRRYRAWQWGCVAGLVVGLVAGLIGSLSGHSAAALVGVALAAMSFGVGARQRQRTWVGINVDRRVREVTITRCHPAFATAAGRAAALYQRGSK